MFQVLNKTPFQVSINQAMDQHGADIAVAAVKATFKIPQNNKPVETAEDQLLPLLRDDYFHKPDDSGIRYPADLVPGKLNTDVGLLGCVYSKNRKPVEKITASVRVGKLYKKIEVYGDRKWKKRVGVPGYDKSRPDLFIEMPITCDRLFGGTDTDPEDSAKTVSYGPNPHGTGFVLHKKNIKNRRLPNFEDPENRLSHWKDKPPVATFGFANPASGHRLKYAGTYDENWRKYHFPLYPADLDLRFFNCAQPELIADGFLEGGEIVQLKNLSKRGFIEFKLPRFNMRLMFRLGDERIYKKAELYTVVIEPELERFYMVWGASMGVGKQPAGMKYVKAEMERADAGNC